MSGNFYNKMPDYFGGMQYYKMIFTLFFIPTAKHKINRILCHFPKSYGKVISYPTMTKFKHILKSANNIVVISGSDMSAECGIRAFKRKSDLWRNLDPTQLDHPKAFKKDPGLVWEFCHYRREMALRAKPSAAHIALAQYEAQHEGKKNISIITQNIDGLHAKAGSKNVFELYGNIFKTRCTKCNEVLLNTDSPICKALAGTECIDTPIPSKPASSGIPVIDLPHCKKPSCAGLLRPHILWYGEYVEPAIILQMDVVLSKCDLCLVIGTSSIEYPATGYPDILWSAGSVVAEFNDEPCPPLPKFNFYFEGASAETIPEMLCE